MTTAARIVEQVLKAREIGRTMIVVTNETKAVLNTERGRVVGFVKSSEPGKISIAVPNDRAVMTPAQARQLAAWLIEEADRGGMTPGTRVGASPDNWRTAERRRQEEIRRALDGDRVRRF